MSEAISKKSNFQSEFFESVFYRKIFYTIFSFIFSRIFSEIQATKQSYKPYRDQRYLDVYKEKQIRVIVKVSIPVKEYPKVSQSGTFSCTVHIFQ
jgi:hypothetical protein